MYLGKGNVARRELSTDKTRRLERIGIVWGPVQAQWEDKYAGQETYVEREGHCIVPKLHQEDGANLGMWLQKQRQGKEEGRSECRRGMPG
jgi:hypothetical protein